MITVLSKVEFAGLVRERPDNQSRKSGYALIDVSPETEFERRHVPDSLNIPFGDQVEICRRFSKEKIICIYANRSNREACVAAAQELSDAGYRRVLQYDSGIEEWSRTSGDDPRCGDNHSLELDIADASPESGVVIIDT